MLRASNVNSLIIKIIVTEKSITSCTLRCRLVDSDRYKIYLRCRSL